MLVSLEKKKRNMLGFSQKSSRKKMNKGSWKAQKLGSQHRRGDEKGRQWNNIVGKRECLGRKRCGCKHWRVKKKKQLIQYQRVLEQVLKKG